MIFWWTVWWVIRVIVNLGARVRIMVRVDVRDRVRVSKLLWSDLAQGKFRVIRKKERKKENE